MAKGKFEYQEVQGHYKSMVSNANAVGDDLTAIDREYKKVVNVEFEAIFGELGQVLLDDWNNVSSNFPKFLEKFEDWSVAVASTAGEYSSFEERFKEFKGQVEKANPSYFSSVVSSIATGTNQTGANP